MTKEQVHLYVFGNSLDTTTKLDRYENKKRLKKNDGLLKANCNICGPLFGLFEKKKYLIDILLLEPYFLLTIFYASSLFI
jgi:hypothetical protein